ncbi:hypothetical protein [Methanolobus vulcani]|uniref:Uncharacterized protein n=1 Tax=Methanolobus vulcani TaxID=38026 RepID=A0A7Z8P3G2_9EURY|nr:hypothetical protein [Methanolobus vulcani]TQD28272.1 hypothetical protein FKV42_00955 [Methanolobus vulcani]
MSERKRAHCPNCGSLTIDWKQIEGRWKCRQCGWKGYQPVYKSQESWEITKQDNTNWLKQLYDLHREHPEYNKSDLRKYGMMGEGTVNRYWKMFVTGKIHVIRPWGEVGI